MVPTGKCGKIVIVAKGSVQLNTGALDFWAVVLVMLIQSFQFYKCFHLHPKLCQKLPMLSDSSKSSD